MTMQYLERLQRIDHLISISGTGTPKQLALKIGISVSMLYEYLMLMKELKAPIAYCKIRQSYYYTWEGRFDFTFRADAAWQADPEGQRL